MKKFNKVINFIKKPPMLFLVLVYFSTIIFIILAIIFSFVSKIPNFFAYIIYALSAIFLSYSIYTIIIFAPTKYKNIKHKFYKNATIKRLSTDYNFRSVIFACLSLTINISYALLNGIYGILNSSIWFGSLSAYYILLSFLRGSVVFNHHKIKNNSNLIHSNFLDKNIDNNKSNSQNDNVDVNIYNQNNLYYNSINKINTNEFHNIDIDIKNDINTWNSLIDHQGSNHSYNYLDNNLSNNLATYNRNTHSIIKELKTYIVAGVILITTILALSIAILQMVSSSESFKYAGYMIYVIAVYTFTKATVAIINFVKAKKYKDITVETIKSINLADTAVSILALQTAMFQSFANGKNMAFANAGTGGVVCALILALGIFMIINGAKQISKVHNSN